MATLDIQHDILDVPEEVERPSKEQLQRPWHEGPKKTAPILLGPVCGTLPHLREQEQEQIPWGL